MVILYIYSTCWHFKLTSYECQQEGHALAEAVAEHVLLCFCSRDPQVSLVLVAPGPDIETEEVVWAGV
jgi:hypothetical protein